MSAQPPKVLPRKTSMIRGQISSKLEMTQGREEIHTLPANAEREVEILNHCFVDVEKFMARLQQAAEAQSILTQRAKKKSRSNRKENKENDLLTKKSLPPPEEDFITIFQKIKYSICLLHRLQTSISQPDAPELLHHIFVPLRLLVDTTGGPGLAASVVSPIMTKGAIALLQKHLTEENHQLWTSLGVNWTSSCSDLSALPYVPIFSGWQSQTFDSVGQLLEDPVQLQYKEEADAEMRQTQQLQSIADADSRGADRADGNGLPLVEQKHYFCAYDFVARNSSELSVLHGEILEVIDSSKRWWKCRNRFDQIGFVPSNILEPAPTLPDIESDNSLRQTESEKRAAIPQNQRVSYAGMSPEAASPIAASPAALGHNMLMPSRMTGEDDSRVLIINDELLKKLAEKRGSVHQAQLNYHSPAAEVETWLAAKGFSQQTVQSLGILNAAQLFSLNEAELCTVSPDEGARVYSNIVAEKTLLEDIRKASERSA